MKDMEDILEFVDEDYGTVKQEKKSRQIKTKKSSFGRISNAWRNFRIKNAEKKLAKEKEKVLTDSYKIGTTADLNKVEKKLLKKTKAIAKLEAKITILSRENVPANYVEDRAIKLKDNMMKNLRFNSDNAYSVDLDKAGDIFAKDSMTNDEDELDNYASKVMEEDMAAMAEEVQEAMKEQENEENSEKEENDNTPEQNSMNSSEQQEEINVVPTTEETQEIKDSVEDGFEQAEMNSEQDLTKEEINDLVDSMINSLESDKEDRSIGREEVSSAVDSAMNDINTFEAAPNVISPEEVESVVGHALDEAQAPISADDIASEIDNAMEGIKVSRSGTAAKLDKFDENGEFIINSTADEVEENTDENNQEYTKYEYKPMTDEEIAQARENIEYDKYEEIYRNQGNVSNNVESSEKATDIFTKIDIPSVSFSDIFKPAEKSEQTIDLPHVETGNETTVESDDVNSVDRDLPMVVPERQTPALYYGDTYGEENQDLHFDYSETTAKDLDSAINKVTSLNEFEELKKRAIELQQQQEYTRRQVEAAEAEAEEAERQAEEAKRIAEESLKAYQAKMEKLRVYTEALEEDCNFNVNRARLAENNTQCNRRFVDAQINKVNENEALMDEIDAIIAPEAVNVRRR